MSCNMKFYFEYSNALEKAINDKFGKITGERFSLCAIDTKSED